MADSIICPSCGETNPPDAIFCENCHSRLEPLPGAVSSDETQDAATPVPDEELPAWLREARAEYTRVELEAESDESSREEPGIKPDQGSGVDLLAGLAAQDHQDDEDVPEWVRRITGMTASEVERQDEADRRIEAEETDAGPDAEGTESAESEDDISAWRLAEESEETETGDEAESETMQGVEPTAAADGTNNEIYEWLKKLDAGAQQDSTPQDSGTFDASVPEWVRNLGGASKPAAAPPRPSQETNVPDWLREMRDADDGEPGQAQDGRTSSDSIASQTPPVEFGELREPDAGGPAEEPVGQEPTGTGSAPPAPESEPGEGLDVDAVFASMQLPEWLSDVSPDEPPSEESGPPAAADDSIAPAELPAWVQAMRPVERPPARPARDGEELPLEPGGPLAGLKGVLPAVPGAGAPSSKPRVHAARLDVSDQQQTHADLLERLLDAEVRPKPMRAASILGSQRALRWALSGLMLLALAGTVFSHSRVFPLPAAVPNESIHAIETINQIPEGSHVLVVFDYQPATVGEMEATAASLLDHLLLLRHPVLAVVSTSPTGSALAERFMSGALAERTYQRGQQYVDLGYLPGGLAGVRAFSEDPPAAITLGAAGDPVWASPLLQGVGRLSDFSAILVLTDGLESGRIWIEQTAPGRGSTPMVVVSSAQAGPMLLPYEDAGQINGLVAGIYGAAGPEVLNAGLPGFVRGYWDAYSLGALLAAAIMFGGGAWHLLAGIRARQAEREV